MKIVVIPDVHGSSYWKELVKIDADIYVFLGDYMDSFIYSHKEQIDNLSNIIYFANNNRNKVRLLIGNHDAHYFMYGRPGWKEVRGSGYSNSLQFKIYTLYESNANLFNVAYQTGEYVFTHAGIVSQWYNKFIKPLLNYKPELSIADGLNLLYSTNPFAYSYVSQYRGGNEAFSSPLWTDKDELIGDINPLHLHQIVGHTQLDKVSSYTHANGSFYFTDCGQRVDQSFILET